LRGGQTEFWSVVTREGLLKYRTRHTQPHATALLDCYPRRSPVHSNLSGIANIQLGEFVSLLPCRVHFRRGLHFFIERWEQETRKPRLVVGPVPRLPYEKVTQIRVRLSPERSVTEDACFFFLLVKNVGEKTAEDVVPLLAVPQLWTSLVKLVIVQPTGDPWMQVDWSGTTDEFEHQPDRFARAVIYDKNTLRDPVSLYGEGLACGFALFFTVKGSPGLYFPSEVHHGILMPCKFQAILYFQAKDLPLFRKVAAYEVEASDWRSIKVTEIVQEQTSSRLRSLFRRKPSKES